MFSLSLFSVFITGLVALGVTLILLPPFRRFAHAHQWLDEPDGKRKIHTESIPRVGGLAIWFGVVAALAINRIMSPEVFGMAPGPSASSLLYLLAGASVAILTGVLDDIYQIRARHKLLGQFFSVFPILLCPEVVAGVAALLGGGQLATLLAYPLILGWGIFMMNAFNLIDGMDGLAGGVGFIAVAFLLMMGGLPVPVVVVCLALMGGLLAFLRHNLPPARVFMGDAGSLMIGYVLAMLGLLSLAADPTWPRALGIWTILAIPLLDATMTIVRRLARRRDPFAPDREHLHHRVLARMFGHQGRAVVVFYMLGLGLGFYALFLQQWSTPVAVVLFGGIVGVGLLLVRELGYFDRESYRKVSGCATGRTMPRKGVRKEVLHMRGIVREPIRPGSPAT